MAIGSVLVLVMPGVTPAVYRADFRRGHAAGWLRVLSNIWVNSRPSASARCLLSGHSIPSRRRGTMPE